jgi:hypothetical protein
MTEPVIPATPLVTSTPIALTPGWKTSEAYVTLLTMLLGAIPSSGLTANAPLFAKIVGMVIAALAAYNYTAQRTVLKRAHLAAQAATVVQLPSSRVPQIAASSVLVVLIVALGIAHSYGCVGTGTGATTPIGTGGNAFLQCGKQDLTQLVGPKGWTLLATVYDDLAKEDYGKLITDLITTVGSDAVGCAVVAIDSLGKTTVGPLALTPREVRSQELITKYNWSRSSIDRANTSRSRSSTPKTSTIDAGQPL